MNINNNTSISAQPQVSLPYAIHINLTSSGQVKLPPQLQPITTSTTSAASSKSVNPLPINQVPSNTTSTLQYPAQLLLNTASSAGGAVSPVSPVGVVSSDKPGKSEANMLGQNWVKAEQISSPHSMGEGFFLFFTF